MASKTFQNWMKLIGWVLVSLALFGACLWALWEHYLSIRSVLERLNMEQLKIIRDPLLGPVVGTLMPEATLPLFLAMSISLLVGISFFIFFKILISILDLAQNLQTHYRQDNKDEVTAHFWVLLKEVFFGTVLLALIIIVLQWDFELFRIRTLMDFEGLPKAPIFLAAMGARGYLALTAIGSLLLEYSNRKVGEKFARATKPISEAAATLQEGASNESDFYGYDADGQPVYDPQTPIAYNQDGQPIEENSAATQPGQGIGAEGEQNTPLPDNHYSNLEAETKATRSAQAQPAHDEPLFDTPAMPHPQAGTTPCPGSADISLVEVIGDEQGERVSFATAKANPARYHVNEQAQQIWRRSYWEELNGIFNSTEKGEAA